MRNNRLYFKDIAIAFSAVVIVVCFVFLPTHRAQAQGLDAADYLSVPIKSYTDAAQKFAHTGVSIGGIPVPFTSLDYFMKLMVKQMIKSLQREIISWIATGRNGNPLFETNQALYMDEVQNKTASDYINNLSQSNNLCDYYKNDVVSALTRYYNPQPTNSSSFNNPKPNLGSGNGCTVDQGKIDAFLQGDFIGGGGWDTWAALTADMNNNPLGAYLKAKEEIDTAVAKNQTNEQEKLNQGKGFHPVEDSMGNVKTPGTVIAEQLNSVLTSDLRQLELAKTFDDVITALATNLISKAISSAEGVLNSSLQRDTNTNDTVRPDYTEAIGDTTSSTETNVAPQGTAKISGEYGAIINGIVHGPEIALAGSKNRRIDYGGVTVSKDQDNPWWEVDLGGSKTITRIVITPPSDEGYTLTNYYVYISDHALGTGDATLAIGAQSGVWKSALITSTNPNHIETITLPQRTTGRYVRIQMVGHGRLEIAGVEVYAANTPAAVPGTTSTSTATNNQTSSTSNNPAVNRQVDPSGSPDGVAGPH